MSIRAMNWAMEQLTDGPSAQSVLFVVADRASEHGVCRHADPDTIADKTRQSRATVFRRLDELERVGLLTRFTRHLDDGRREYEVRLALERFVNYRVDKDRNISLYDLHDSDCEDDPIEVLSWDGSQIETQGGSQIETESVAPVRPSESQSCDSQEDSDSPSKSPNPPNPPSGGGPVVDQELEETITEFARGYPAPITNLPRLRTVLGAMTPTERAKVLVAEKGYSRFIAECERKGKPRAVKDADRWVSSGMWQGYLVSGERAEVQARMQQVPVDSREGRALIVLHRIAGMARPFEAAGKFLLREPMPPSVLALADAPDGSGWKFIPAEDRNRCGAWNEFVDRALCGKNRPVLVNNRNPGGALGFMAPWDWPPRKDGTLSGETLCTEDDMKQPL